MKPYEVPPHPPATPCWLNSEELDVVKHDTHAMSAYELGRYGFGASNPEIRSQLLRYCQFDKSSMVMTWMHWVR